MMLKKNRNKGFTLIELLVVIGIISILAAIALPAYKEATIKAKLGEVTNAMSYLSMSLVIYHHAALNESSNVWPNCGSIVDIRTSLGVALGALERIAAASVDQGTGVISVTVANTGAAVDGTTITLSPSIAADSTISWKWGGTIAPQYLPKN